MKSSIAIVFSLVCIAFFSGPAAATPIFFDDFEPESGGGLNYSSFANWDVLDGTVDIVSFSCSICVDLDGTSGNAGRLETKSLF